MNYGFIGLGNMGGAIIKGMVSSGSFAGDNIYGINRSPEKTRNLHACCGLIPCQSVTELAQKSDIIVLSVKPQMLSDVLPMLSALPSGKLVISISAGKTLSWYAPWFPEGTPVIRVMPNMNAQVCASVTSVCGNEYVTEEQLDIARKIFLSVGSVYELQESFFPAFSAICGASGAFVFMYIDALAEAGVRAGFPRKMAEEMATATVMGAAKMKTASDEHPIALMKKICSPGGTTIEGVLKLRELGFATAVQQSIQAIIDKDSKI